MAGSFVARRSFLTVSEWEGRRRHPRDRAPAHHQTTRQYIQSTVLGRVPSVLLAAGSPSHQRVSRGCRMSAVPGRWVLSERPLRGAIRTVLEGSCVTLFALASHESGFRPKNAFELGCQHSLRGHRKHSDSRESRIRTPERQQKRDWGRRVPLPVSSFQKQLAQGAWSATRPRNKHQ